MTVRRRRFLAGLVGTGLLGTAGCLGGGSGNGGTRDEPDQQSTADAQPTGTDGARPQSLPVTVDGIEARGSSAGPQRIPVEGTVTVIDLFATWCPPCKEQMNILSAVHEELGDADDVQFVSVTNERLGNGLTEEDLRGWWLRYDGDWTLANDPDGDLLRILGATGIPYLVVFDASGEITKTHRGIIGRDALREEIEKARGT